MATSTEIAIATTTLGSAASSITFSSIPSTYTDLRLVVVPTSGASVTVALRFNSDTGTNYSRTYLFGNGASADTLQGSNMSQIYIIPADTNQVHLAEWDIFSYLGSTYKTVLGKISADTNGSGYSSVGVGLWRNTTAITTVQAYTFSNQFQAGTTATLYGIL